MLDGKAATRAAKPRAIDLKANKVVKGKGTRASSLGNDTLMYVFNFEGNEGFAVVAAPQNVEPLIAVTEKGSYDPENPGNNEGFNQYMENAEKYIANSLGNGPDLPAPIGYDKIKRNLVVKGPYVTVNWGEFNPEGEMCSNGIAGCVNAAIAEIMSYYEYPTSIDLTYSGADISTQALNWAQMKAHQPGHTLDSCSTTEIHKSIGRLHRQIGQLTRSVYLPTQTKTFSMYVADAIEDLGYSTSGEIAYDTIQIVDQLNAHHPLVMIGGGNAWLTDGYQRDITIIEHYERVAANVNEYVLVGTDTYNYYYYHFNWGWYGDCNGYFAKNVFDTQAASWYDDTSNHSYDFGSKVKTVTMYPNPEE